MKTNMDRGGIYAIVNVANGKQYIGSCSLFKRRKKYHFSRLNRGKHPNSYLQNSYNKHGMRSFDFRILEVVDDFSTLEKREQYFIDLLQVCSPEKGYNLSPKAYNSTGIKRSEACKEKHREIMRELWQDEQYREKTLSMLRSEDHRSKLRNYAIKKFRTKKCRKERSRRAKLLWQDNSFREKMMVSKKGLWNDPAYRQKCLAARFPEKYGEHSGISQQQP